MKVRLKFTKEGEMKFIGHLDLMRCFQKVIRRSGIDIKFSEGLSPHMVMSFASPLSVGLTSLGEYVDMELVTPVSSAEGVRRLNEQMPAGIRALSLKQIPEGRANGAMALVAAAEYTVRFREGKAPAAGWEDKVPAFLAQETISAVKETKKGETTVNIRPLIYRMEAAGGEVKLRLAGGSEANLKPELLMDTFVRWLGEEPQPFSLLICRTELLAKAGGEQDERFVPLEDLGEDIIL